MTNGAETLFLQAWKVPPSVAARLSLIEVVKVFDVEYLHVRPSDNADLYITRFGLPFIENLLPENHWNDTAWFRANSTSLSGHDIRFTGTSAIYRIRTKEVRGKSKDIVLKWNRMGQDVPGQAESRDPHELEFNSPYEEFALVMEMREAHCEISAGRIHTHKPLAIYVPDENMELWESGRREHKMQRKMDGHADIELDMHRPYAVIYEWVEGMDLLDARRRGAVSEDAMRALTREAEEDMKTQGFLVKDSKPQHVIVRLDRSGAPLRNRRGRLVRAMVDFELLQRSPEREELVKRRKRREYLMKQAHRFDAGVHMPMLPHLKTVPICGVDYIYGHAESTGGALWVVGKDPSLFDFFLPERWSGMPRMKMSPVNQTYHTISKDNIHLVWKMSRVGESPDRDPFRNEEKRILAHGYNSPFEEVALAMELTRKGIPTVYPRAIYMTGYASELVDHMRDNSRYETHKSMLTPDGTPVLRKDRDYIIVWGYWNKPDDVLASADEDYYQAIDALHALRIGVLSEQSYLDLMQRTRSRLADIGIEDLNLRGGHLLLSRTASGQFVTDKDGFPEARICNFELLRKLG